MIRTVIATCIVALGVSGAFAARLSKETRGAALLSPRAVIKPITRPLATMKAQARSAPPRRKTRRKNKTTRRPDIFYRWSADQLMLGGVNPSRIGKSADDAIGKAASESAASPIPK
ncbi:hypothetical protein ACFQ3P_05415 [Paraburkholderia sabiae]|uniref:DUF4148 domain-containing protein n=1 Tax=Paraburkholderia sabiae TaxID=273251 RepID=A0ABU9QEB5_9BURK|nr:hypothetical protein [Paraburkholderia sabiae]WJZ76740.1 hypothetical protein QEN71_13360 [Paraburkholderia sabiae]CAD6546190.1 hypothetical protein LMG24235_04269 [Paraburkholderia sabiae]